jgi:hypothetical protein
MSRIISKLTSLSLFGLLGLALLQQADAAIVCSVCAHDTVSGVTVCHDIPCPGHAPVQA